MVIFDCDGVLVDSERLTHQVVVDMLAERGVALAWATRTTPADNSGSTDPVSPYEIEMLHMPGSNFAVCTFNPGAPANYQIVAMDCDRADLCTC